MMSRYVCAAPYGRIGNRSGAPPASQMAREYDRCRWSAGGPGSAPTQVEHVIPMTGRLRNYAYLSGLRHKHGESRPHVAPASRRQALRC